MKKITILLFLTSILISCDPFKCSEGSISNLTSFDIIITWHGVNSRENKTIQINRNETLVVHEEACEKNNARIIEYAIAYDSVTVASTQQQILKVWRPRSLGKNIFNTNTDWIVSATGKFDSSFLFEIRNADLED